MDNIGKIIFIGAGRMASAIAGGLLKNKFDKENILAIDNSKDAAEKFEKATGIAPVATQKIEKAVSDSDIVIIAVKPQNIDDLAELKPLLKDKLVISIAAGTTIEKLIKVTDNERIVRVMPNTPALVGEGVSAYSVSSAVSASDSVKVEAILGSFGICNRVEEKHMDAVTGLSGSGPAYVFDFIQAMADAGVNAGLPRDVAQQFAAQTVLGAAKMALETDVHISELRDRVTSPGGTTARALAVLEQNAFKGIVGEAVLAAVERSAELGKK